METEHLGTVTLHIHDEPSATSIAAIDYESILNWFCRIKYFPEAQETLDPEFLKDEVVLAILAGLKEALTKGKNTFDVQFASHRVSMEYAMHFSYKFRTYDEIIVKLAEIRTKAINTGK